VTRINLTPRQHDIATLLLRLVFGGFMLYSHGWPKLQRLFGDDPIKFADPFGIGATASLSLTVFAEFLCAALILVGLKTRLATVPLIITMLVAAFVIHASDPFGDKEMALIYLVGYIVIFLLGPGRYSVDERL
jgi:putative oxidoreductase